MGKSKAGRYNTDLKRLDAGQANNQPKIKTTKTYTVGFWDGYRNVVFATKLTEREAELSYADALDAHKGKRVLLVEQEYNELGKLIEERVLLRSR